MRKIVVIVKQILKKRSKSSQKINASKEPQIIPREAHTISRSHISQAALKVLYRLHKFGFSAYLVGGSVRDLLLGLSPKDFDVVTNALPEEIQRLFSNSFIIGRRFRLVHVRFGNEIIEVATFRGNTKNNIGRVKTQHGVLLRDNVYGTLEDDVWRRDFTVNALYYNIADFSVIDYVNGMADLEKKCLRVIGDPIERYREDPARMLRGIRLAGKLDFSIEPSSAEPIRKYRELILHVPPARLFDKMLKIFHSGKSYAIFQLMQEYGLFEILFPQVAASLRDQSKYRFVEEAFKNTDQRINENKTINSAFLFAVMLWCPVQERKTFLVDQEDMNFHQAFHLAMSEVLSAQIKLITIPRRFTTIIREIWNLQYHLENPRPKRILKVFYHPRFRAAYDFLVLRATNETALQEVGAWWTHFQECDEEGREKLIASRFGKPRNRKRKRKRGNDDQSLSGAG